MDVKGWILTFYSIKFHIILLNVIHFFILFAFLSSPRTYLIINTMLEFVARVFVNPLLIINKFS